jgi:hypothetical protein
MIVGQDGNVIRNYVQIIAQIMEFVTFQQVYVLAKINILRTIVLKNIDVLMTALEMVFAEKNKFVNVMMDGLD